MRDPKQNGPVSHSWRMATLVQRCRDRENNTAPQTTEYLSLFAKKDLNFNELFAHSSL